LKVLLFAVNTSDASEMHVLQLHSCGDEVGDFGQAARYWRSKAIFLQKLYWENNSNQIKMII